MSFHHFFLDGQIIAEETAQEFPVRLSAEDAKHACCACPKAST